MNRPVLAQAAREGFVHSLSDETIDVEIRRIGGPVRTNPRITDGAEYARLVAAAMAQDAAASERRHPGFTNVLLCGGKDSLNMTLLPWKNDPVVASAPPNHELVAHFLEENDVGIPLIRLDDPTDPDVLCHEVLENACRADLTHFRWGAHLRSLARELGHRVVFWKGQMFGAISTPKWMSYSHAGARGARLRRRYHQRIAPLLPRSMQRLVFRRWLDPAFRLSIWRKGAMLQGAHMSLIREITDSLVLSAYHGRATSDVLRQVDLWQAVTSDIRPAIGLALHGGGVTYPAENPRPERSKQRHGLHRPEHLLSLLRLGGVTIVE